MTSHTALVLLLSTSFACAGEDKPVKPMPSPRQAQQELVSVRKGAEQARWDLDALRCYLLHQEEKKAGKAPKGWEQPPVEAYEISAEHPCTLLPGFVDPMKAQREALEKAKKPAVTSVRTMRP